VPKKEYTRKWFDADKSGLVNVLSEYKGSTKYLEIGSFEGRSTCWFLANIITGPGSKAYCIDTWQGGFEHAGIDFDDVEDRFDKNTAGYREKIVKLKGTSFEQLASLVRGHRNSFDVVYVDGSHTSWDVLSDCVLSFNLCKVGGIIGLDDYLWGEQNLNAPKPAIDSFLYIYDNFLQVIKKDYQVWVKRIS